MAVRTLYVGNLSYTVTERLLKELFSMHGVVRQVRSYISRGYAFVEMANADDAQKAKKALNGLEIEGRKLTVNYALPPKRKSKKRSQSGP